MKKQILKQLTALVMTGTMCLSFAGAVDAKPFSDVGENDWYYYAVAMAHDVGYMNGYPDGTFHPNATITRAECVAIIDRMADPTIPIGQEIQFEDIPSSAWYNSSAAVCGQVMAAHQSNICNPILWAILRISIQNAPAPVKILRMD